jgi:hypothetical protein
MQACNDLDLDQEGEGLKDFVGKIKKAKIGKKIIGFAKEHKLGNRIANAVIERALSTIAGSGVDSGVVPEPAKKKEVDQKSQTMEAVRFFNINVHQISCRYQEGDEIKKSS